MSALQDASRKLSHTELLDTLNDRRRRQTLRLLRDESGSITERELAERLLVDGGNKPVEELADVTIDGVRIQLRHVHLPRLAEAGLLEWDEDAGTVAPTDAVVYDDPGFARLIEMDDEDWDDVLGGLTEERLRDVVSVLRAEGEHVRRDVLAHKIAAREADGESWAEAVNDVRTELHHVHLPKLDGAGLVDYDVEDGTVTYRGHPSDEEWQRHRR